MDLQSGGFVAGNFLASKQDFANSYPHNLDTGVKIYWFPRHTDQMEPLTVEATRITGEQLSSSAQFSDVVRPSGGGALFYPSGVPIPEPGTWKLVATAGPDKGCFIVTFSPSS